MEVVELNVGGTLYATTKATLSRHPASMLARMLESDLPPACIVSGAPVQSACETQIPGILDTFWIPKMFVSQKHGTSIKSQSFGQHQDLCMPCRYFIDRDGDTFKWVLGHL